MRIRAWIQEAKTEMSLHGGASLTLTLVVPNASHEDLSAIREAMDLPITKMSYPLEVIIEDGENGEVTVTDEG